MPHTTRKNYKSKLIESESTASRLALQSSSIADKAHVLLENESIAKKQVHSWMSELAVISLDLVRVLDDRSDVGGMRFVKCEEINDDKLGLYNMKDMCDRIMDIVMAAEERVVIFADKFAEATAHNRILVQRLSGLTELLEENEQLQHEFYNIGKDASSDEIAAFERAEAEGISFHRTFADRDMQIHNINDEDLIESDEESVAPIVQPKIEQEIEKKATSPSAKTNGKKAHKGRG